MAATAQQAKVLRIGVIQDGKIVQERLIKQGETVQVGESPKNTFVLPKTDLPKGEFALFVYKNGAYQLQFTEAMKGKVSSNGAVVALERLRTDPSVQSAGGVWRVPLTEEDRGKVSIGDVTILFQFVPPPPVQVAKPLERMDFRPAWFEEDDPAFFGFLSLFTALAVVFGVGIYLAPRAPEPSFADYKDRFAQIQEAVRDKAPEKPPEDKPLEDLNASRTEAKAKPDEDQPQETKVTKAPKTKAEAEDYQRKVEAMRMKMRIAQIGSLGDSRGGTITDPFGDGQVLDTLRGLSGSDVAVDGDPQGTRGGNYTRGDMNIDGELKVDAPQTTQATAAPKFKVQLDQEKGDLLDLEGDGASVEDVIRRMSGQLQACYENELRGDPNLEGRVEVRFNISSGRVTKADVIGNTSGSAALGECITRRVRMWKFDPEVSGPLSWSWMFRKR
jgi:hypothetical protein